MRQAVVGHQRGDVRQFGLLGAEELLARRHVEEEIAHRNVGAARVRHLVAMEHLAASDLDARAGGFVGGASLQKEARDGGDGR